MKQARVPKKNTAAKAIFDAMTMCVRTNEEVRITNLNDSLGRKISKNTFSPAISRIKKHHFGGLHFYTRAEESELFLGFIKEIDENNNQEKAPDSRQLDRGTEEAIAPTPMPTGEKIHRLPKKHTILRLVFDLMSNAYESGNEKDITNLTNFHGEKVPRTSISMYMNKVGREFFPGASFYTRTIRPEGKLVIGCFTPAVKTKINDAERLAPHSPSIMPKMITNDYDEYEHLSSPGE